MVHRIERRAIVKDAKAATLLDKLRKEFPVTAVERVDNFLIDANLSEDQQKTVGEMLVNSVVEEFSVDKAIAPENFDWAVEVGRLPGVTDNVGSTISTEIKDRLSSIAPVYTSETFFLSGVDESDAKKIAETLYNPQIERARVVPREKFSLDKTVPRVTLTGKPAADIVELFVVDKKGKYMGDISDDELRRIGKSGIFDHNRELTEEEYLRKNQANSGNTLSSGDIFMQNGKFFEKVRRGPLSMRFEYMKAMQAYFKKRGKNPTDIELETIAQTWSEHCKHTKFADPIDEIADGLYKHFIKKATEDIRAQWKKEGEKDFLRSVFTDNSGVFWFDDGVLATHKVETHNSPSALDPKGGSITGINGVHRDSMGCGLFAEPVINTFGFCVGNPDDKRTLYRKADKSDKLLSPRRILEGVVEGVKEGGNCTGTPTPQGFVRVDNRYRGKPLVYVGSVGIMPETINGKFSHEKKAKPGDYIVMTGGRVGKDGIHGATMSSESLNSGSPVSAVQIGAPITQKNMSDALLEARKELLYNSITDNGAGGLSSAVGEMSKEAGGCLARLESVPTKYPNMSEWEIWVSESQERMTLAVPPEKWPRFKEIMDSRNVEATVIGCFTDKPLCTVTYFDQASVKENTIVELDMNFLHDGLPKIQQKSAYTKPAIKQPDLRSKQFDPNQTKDLLEMLARPNVASTEFISMQFDHEVKAGSVLKPLQGRGRVNANATVTRPVLSSKKGLVLSQGLHPSYSEMDTYRMAANSIDTAVKNAIIAGANPERLYLLDNFCWCSSDEPERLGQLKEAAKACYDYAVAYRTPFISGKDSMYNDFKGFDENGKEIKISAPPTLLISSIGVIEDIGKAVSLDAKNPRDLVYVLGETFTELGGSEYLAMLGQEDAGEVSKVDADRNIRMYHSLARCIKQELVESAQGVDESGLAVALAKTAIGGKLGMDVSLEKIPGTWGYGEVPLWSASAGRVVVTVAQQNRSNFEKLMAGNAFAMIGMTTSDKFFTVRSSEGVFIDTNLDAMVKSYKGKFEGF